MPHITQTQTVLNITNCPKHHCAVMFRTASDVAPAGTGGCCVRATAWRFNTFHTTHIPPHTSKLSPQDLSRTIPSMMQQHGASGALAFLTHSPRLHTFAPPPRIRPRPFHACLPQYCDSASPTQSPHTSTPLPPQDLSKTIPSVMQQHGASRAFIIAHPGIRARIDQELAKVWEKCEQRQ